MASNMSNYLASNRVRGASERVRHDTVTMCHELDDKTKRTQVGQELVLTVALMPQCCVRLSSVCLYSLVQFCSISSSVLRGKVSERPPCDKRRSWKLQIIRKAKHFRWWNVFDDNMCTVWVKKNPPEGSWHFPFFTNGWEFLIDFLHTYYTFLCTLDCKFLFNYPRFWRSYAILSATTQFT